MYTKVCKTKITHTSITLIGNSVVDVSPINVDAANANVVREDRILFMQPFYNKDIDRIQYKIKWQGKRISFYVITFF